MKKHKHGNGNHQTHNALIVGLVAIVAIVSLVFLLPDSTLVGLGGGITPAGKQTATSSADGNYLTAPDFTIEGKGIAGLERRYIDAYSLDCSAVENGVSIKITGLSDPPKIIQNTCAKDYNANAFQRKTLQKYPEGVVKFGCDSVSRRPVGKLVYCNSLRQVYCAV